MRWIRVGWIIVIAFMVSVSVAQEDLGWLLSLIPTGSNIDLEKQLEQGAVRVNAGENLLDETFTVLNAWDSSSDREGNRRVRNERYEMRLVDSDIIYTAPGSEEYDDVIITVDTQRLSDEPNDGYGLVCRSEDEDNGVHFYISSDGYWRIFNFINGRARPFMPWTASELINQGEGVNNQITAVCIEDYYALYINGELVGEARNDTFDSGAVGMSVIVFEEESEVFIAFDNLRLWSGSSDDTSAIDVTDTSNSTSPVDEQRAETILLLGDGDESVSLGALQFYDSMDSDDNWHSIDADQGDFDFDDGIVTMLSEADTSYPLLLVTDERYDNAVIQAEMTFEGGTDNNAFGIVCRSSEADKGRGYQFMISADGYYSIWLTDNNFYRFIVDWERSSDINPNSSNQLTAVCVDDYLAFYLNGSLLVDLYNDVYQTGTAGVAVFTFEDEEDSSISVDNIFVWDAELP